MIKKITSLFCVLAFFIALGGCSAGIDWDEVDKALNEPTGYIAKSLKEAEAIVGYHIPTIKNVPQGFNKEPMLQIFKLNPLVDKPVKELGLEVIQNWTHKEGIKSGNFTLDIKPLPEPAKMHVGENDTFEIVAINGREVKTYLRADGLVFRLDWYVDGINYSLYGGITDTLTKETYLEMAKDIIR